SKPYLYEIPELDEHFEYIVVKNNLSQKVGDKMEYSEVVRQLGKKINISYYLKTVVSFCAQFISYDEIFQPLSEIVLGVLKKFKDSNKVNDSGMNGDNLNKEDENEMDEDEISKIRDD